MQYEGRLDYRGFAHRPWTLELDEGGPLDLFPIVDNVLKACRNKSASHQHERGHFSFGVDGGSEYILLYDPEDKKDNPILTVPDGFGFSNLGHYLDQHLTWLSARRVIVQVSDERFAIEADPREGVYGVKFTDGNSCDVPADDVKRVCKPGTDDCCIFLTAGPKGFQCEKFSGMQARMLLHRFNNGQMRASRIGSCAILGRAT